jgi:hypothetical protein
MSQTTKQPKGNRTTTIALIAGGLAIAGVTVWLFSQKSSASAPVEKGVIYYTGPKRNINTGLYVDAAGHVVPPPPGEEGKPFIPPKRPTAE